MATEILERPTSLRPKPMVRFSELKPDLNFRAELERKHGSSVAAGYVDTFNALRETPFKQDKRLDLSLAHLAPLSVGQLLEKPDLTLEQLNHLKESSKSVSATTAFDPVRERANLVYHLITAKAIHEHGLKVFFPPEKAKPFTSATPQEMKLRLADAAQLPHLPPEVAHYLLSAARKIQR